MNNGLAFVFLAFALSGLVFGPMEISHSFADPGDNPDKGQGKKKAKGCDNGTAKNNPHCDGNEDPTFSPCDVNDDGTITAEELETLGIPDTIAQGIIDLAEDSVKNSNQNGVIDSDQELEALNILLDGRVIC